MSIDKDTSEELGLDSRPSQFDKHRRGGSHRALRWCRDQNSDRCSFSPARSCGSGFTSRAFVRGKAKS